MTCDRVLDLFFPPTIFIINCADIFNSTDMLNSADMLIG